MAEELGAITHDRATILIMQALVELCSPDTTVKSVDESQIMVRVMVYGAVPPGTEHVSPVCVYVSTTPPPGSSAFAREKHAV